MREKNKELGDETQTAREPNAETGLAPCPFCGEAPAPSTDGGYVKCQNSACGIAGQVLTTNLWNKRAPLTAKKVLEGETRMPQGGLRSGLWTGDEDGTLRFAGKLMYLGKTVEGESKAKIIADAHNL